MGATTRPLRIVWPPETSQRDGCQEMIELANQLQREIHSSVNGLDFVAHPGDELEHMLEEWEIKRTVRYHSRRN